MPAKEEVASARKPCLVTSHVLDGFGELAEARAFGEQFVPPYSQVCNLPDCSSVVRIPDLLRATLQLPDEWDGGKGVHGLREGIPLGESIARICKKGSFTLFGIEGNPYRMYRCFNSGDLTTAELETAGGILDVSFHNR